MKKLIKSTRKQKEVVEFGGNSIDIDEELLEEEVDNNSNNENIMDKRRKYRAN